MVPRLSRSSPDTPYNPVDLSAILSATRAGEAAALGMLYKAYADMLYQLAYRLTRSTEDAQDLVHDCFVGLPRALRHYQERGSFEAWLRRVLIRLVQMRRRVESRRRESGLDTVAALIGSLPAEASSEIEEIRQVIDSLPQPLRDVFVLKVVEGYSHDDIADLCGITAGASRVRLTRALKLVRRSLASYR